MEDKLDKMLLKLEIIETRLKTIEKSLGVMESHVEFVDGVYDKVRSPLEYITSSINMITGYGGKKSPLLLKRPNR